MALAFLLVVIQVAFLSVQSSDHIMHGRQNNDQLITSYCYPFVFSQGAHNYICGITAMHDDDPNYSSGPPTFILSFSYSQGAHVVAHQSP